MADNFDDFIDGANDLSSAFSQARQAIKDALSGLKDPDIVNTQKSISRSLERQVKHSDDLNRINKDRLGTQKLSTDLSNKITQIIAEQSNLLNKQSFLSNALEASKNRIFDTEQKLAGAKGKRKKDLEKIHQALLSENKSLLKGLEHTYRSIENTEELRSKYEGIRDLNEEILEEQRKANEEEEKRKQLIDEQHEGYNKVGKALGKIPLMGSLLSNTFGKINDKVRKLRKEGKEITFKDILNEAISLTAAFGFVLNQMMKINEAQVSLQKEMNLSSNEASNFYSNMVQVAASSNDVAISVGKLLKAQQSLNKETGVYNKRSQETLITFSKLVDKVGLSAEAASSLEMMSKLTGTNFDKQVNTTAAVGINMLRAKGISFSQKELFDQISKVTGQVAANLGNNPIKIAEAVAQSKILGTTLEGVAKIANDLLNFESSISKELEAELLVGRDLNLERARALALAGKQGELAKELVKQVGTYAEYNDMNVIQQQKLADAFGMSADEMANMLKLQEYQGQSAEYLRSIGETELAEMREKQTLQQSFNNLVEKLQTMFVNIANGPLGSIASFMSSILENSFAVYTIFGGIAALMTGKMLMGLSSMVARSLTLLGIETSIAAAKIAQVSATTLGLGIVGVVAGLTAGMLALSSTQNKAQQINDGVIDPQGGVVVSGPKGSIQLNKQDSIIAGTNLFDNPQPQTVVQPSITPQEMSNAIKEGMRGLQIVQEGVPMGQVMSKNIALHGDIPSSIA